MVALAIGHRHLGFTGNHLTHGWTGPFAGGIKGGYNMCVNCVPVGLSNEMPLTVINGGSSNIFQDKDREIQDPELNRKV